MILNTEEILHASAPPGYRCSDCTMDKEPCPTCYTVWWQKRHPNTNLISADDSVVFAANQRARQAEQNAARYLKLRRWMSSNVQEGWSEVEKLAAVSCYMGWARFDLCLDALPECNVGLCQTTAKLFVGG